MLDFGTLRSQGVLFLTSFDGSLVETAKLFAGYTDTVEKK